MASLSGRPSLVYMPLNHDGAARRTREALGSTEPDSHLDVRVPLTGLSGLMEKRAYQFCLRSASVSPRRITGSMVQP